MKGKLLENNRPHGLIGSKRFMATISYIECAIEVRADLIESQQRCWDRLGRPGTWLDGRRKIAVAAETRNARGCRFCQQQKDALSPNAAKGAHGGLGELSANEVDVIHRIVSDPGRLSKAWYSRNREAGLSGEQFVEIVSIVAMVVMVDTFTFAMGLPDHLLPEPVAGEPTRYRSPGAKVQAAWVPIVEPKDVSDSDGDLYPSPEVRYIQRALSSVPEAKRQYWDLVTSHYLPREAVYRLDSDIRAINRMQMELIAAKTSALYQCLY
jgi:alkylhydroperoxidase family enzyme